MFRKTTFAAALALGVAATGAAHAQSAAALGEASKIQRINNWTVGLAGGLLEGTFVRYAADIAKVLDDGDNLRVLPIVSYGAVGNVSDLLYLKGVDAAITQGDVLDYYRTELKIANIDQRIHYVARLFHSEVHIYARQEFSSIKDLEGKKVNFNTTGSAANLTGGIVFDRLGVKVERLFLNNSVALEKMRTGEISAIVHVVGKPNDLFSRFKPEPGFRFLPVEYDRRFMDYYVPTELTSDDYPNLMPAGTKVPTIAIPTLLAVYNWPNESDRYRRVARFIEYFFDRFEQLKQPPYQPKWKEMNLAATVPGWTRYRVAEEQVQRILAKTSENQSREQFEQFLSERGPSAMPRGRAMTNQERDALFRDFSSWQQTRARR